jgi:glycine/D-amino acid oxidase-like deaminating enzyme
VNRLERGRGAGAFLIETERGSLSSESVLVATSGYTGSVTRKLQKKIVPIGSFIIATERLPDELAN